MTHAACPINGREFQGCVYDFSLKIIDCFSKHEMHAAAQQVSNGQHSAFKQPRNFVRIDLVIFSFTAMRYDDVRHVWHDDL